jgi:hypothetical protein
MRSRILVAACSIVAAFAVASPALAADDLGDFNIEWGTFKKANKPAADSLRKSGAMEQVLAEINNRYALPGNVDVAFTDELDVGPAFIGDLKLDDGTTVPPFIIFPGSFMTLEVKLLRKELRGVRGLRPVPAMIYANQFVLAHEAGHALVHQLDLPVTGREEDAVDGFAAYLLADNPSFGAQTAISAALLFDALAQARGKIGDGDFADEHSFPEQRTYQFLCWVYGSDPKRFRSIVGRDGLPRERAARCGDEWRQLNSSWSRLLAPYAKAA